jgi:hypothetical protein
MVVPTPSPAPTATCRAVDRRLLKDLTLHPELFALVGEPAEADVERLARALADGRDAGPLPEVTPDGRVIAGYQVVSAAGLAELAEIDVVVRDALAGQSDALVTLVIIDLALDGGGLAPLGVARCIRRAHQLRRGIPYDEIRPYQRGEVEDQVASRLGLSKRNAQRYVRLLGAPAEVQTAYCSGKLSLTLAERAAGLPDAKQRELVAALAAGEDPREALARYVKVPSKRHRDAHKDMQAFLRSLQRGLDDLDGRTQDVLSLYAEDADLIDRAVELLQSVRAKAVVVSPRQQAATLEALRQSMKPSPP